MDALNQAKFSLYNIAECMRLCEDMRNPNNAIIVNAAYKWIRLKVECGLFTITDREYFMRKFYHQAKNK